MKTEYENVDNNLKALHKFQLIFSFIYLFLFIFSCILLWNFYHIFHTSLKQKGKLPEEQFNGDLHLALLAATESKFKYFFPWYLSFP